MKSTANKIKNLKINDKWKHAYTNFNTVVNGSKYSPIVSEIGSVYKEVIDRITGGNTFSENFDDLVADYAGIKLGEIIKNAKESENVKVY